MIESLSVGGNFGAYRFVPGSGSEEKEEKSMAKQKKEMIFSCCLRMCDA